MTSCLILPTYNEAGNLERLVLRIRETRADVHILVVDDSSPDGTGEIADRLARGRTDLSVLHRTGRRRYGDALTEGMRLALSRGFEALLTMDCDFSHDPAAIPSLLEALGECDVAIGSRYVEGGRLRAWPRHRRWLSAGANAFVSALFDLPAHDCTSGYRAYRRAAVDSIPWRELNSHGYSCIVELLFWAVRRRNALVREIPIVFTERRAGRSKMGLREIFGGALSLLALRARLARSWRRVRLESGLPEALRTEVEAGRSLGVGRATGELK